MPDDELDRPEPGEVAASPEALLLRIDTVPARLGFVETSEMRAAHEAVLAASESTVGSVATIEALRAYQALGEALVDQIPDGVTHARARAQIGLSVTVATMDRERGDTVRYLQGLLDAYDYAGNMSLNDVQDDVYGEIARHAQSAEFLQARGEFEEAVDLYLERDHVSGLGKRERGLTEFRVVECYLAMAEAKAEPDDELSELISVSMESLLAYLDGEPEFERALELLDKISPQV